MSELIVAEDLRAGDWIKAPEGLVHFHQVPLKRKRKKTFTAYYAKGTASYPVTYNPTDEIEVFARWPESLSGAIR